MKTKSTVVKTPNPNTMAGCFRTVCATRLLPLLLFLLLPAVVQAQYQYTTNNNTITITGYTGSGGAVSIPNTINGLPVTSIGASAFDNCTSLTSVTIPASVTYIAYLAFYGCSSLTSVTIGSGVTDIVGVAFGGCTNLRAFVVDPNNLAYSSVGAVLFDKSQTTLIEYPGVAGSYTIPNSVTSIADDAFEYCYNLTSVTIPTSVTNIGVFAFGDCNSLSAITVDPGNSVYSNISGVLFDKSQTTLIEYPGGQSGSYTVPSSVTRIGNWAFNNCTGLTGVTIPDSVTSIGWQAFDGTSLTSVVIPSSVTSIPGMAFFQCYDLASVTIPDTVTSIGESAFSDCTSLTSVVIPNGVTSIGESAFSDCSSLTNVTIPNSVTSIEDYGFGYCTKLTGVYFLGNAPSLGGPDVFVDVGGYDPATVYYLPGATGFGTMFGGLPTALWTGQSLVIVNVTANPTQGGTVVGGGAYTVGSSQQISASANSGWAFTGWSDGGAQTHNITVPSGGATYTANFAATTACTYTLSAASVTLAAKGGSKNLSVKVKGTDCSWTAVSNDPFITITAGSGGTGNGKVGYTVPGNTNTTALSGTMTIAGQTFTVNQAAGGCTYKLSPKAGKIKAPGGSATVKVKPNFSDCAWTAVSNDSFITITDGTSGTGKGTVSYTVAANTNTTVVTGSITIGGQSFTVTQAGEK